MIPVHSQEQPTQEQRELVRYAAVFEQGDPPRTGRLAFWPAPHAGRTDGHGGLDVVVPEHGTLRKRTVTADRLSLDAALPILLGADTDAGAEQVDPCVAFWAAATRFGLSLIARHRLRPTVSPGGFDAWRIGPLDDADTDYLRRLAGAMPPRARARPDADTGSPTDAGDIPLPAPERLLRQYLDALADTLPRRTPDGSPREGTTPFAGMTVRHVPELRGHLDADDSAVRISLRLDAHGSGYTDFHAVVQVHSRRDPALVIDAADLWAGSTTGFGPQPRIDTVLAVRRAAIAWPALQPILRQEAPDEITLSDQDVEELLGGAGARLGAAGVEVHWPRELVRDLSARATVRSAETDPPAAGLLGSGELLEFDWRLALGDQPLSAAEMDRLAEATRPVVRLREQWVLADPGMVRKARERELKPLAPIDGLRAALSGTAEVDGERAEVSATGWLEALRERISGSGATEPVEQPEGLAADLRDYQLTGLRWLAGMTSLGLGCCLADDMGLGKTITVIALHLHRASGPTLVVCPASLLGNWERELARFAPGTRVRRFHGARRNLGEPADGDVVLTTYATMRLDAGTLATVAWDMVVADEAQHVKNPASGTARALRAIHAPARVALTGTPVENNLSELWAILDWATPGLLGTSHAFRERWAKPIESDGDTELAERLSRLVRPFLLRRTKTDPGIAPELPRKTETDQPVSLTTEQAALYRAVVRETMEAISGAEGMARRGLVMKLLTSLKQICNHPDHYLAEGGATEGRSGKLELLDELLDTITAERGAVLLFTQYVRMARLLEKHLAGRGNRVRLLHGGTPVAQREQLVGEFQRGDIDVFLLSVKAAGTGLNLTRADHVVHYDRWWNPAVEDQATDRAYRIGQTKPVQVHRMITEGTVEDRIADMLRAKKGLADSVLRSGEAALSELSDTELAELVDLREAP